MTDYYPHDQVTSKLPLPNPADEHALFGGEGDLLARAQAFGKAHGYHILVREPCDDVLQSLAYLSHDKVMVILKPGVYREITYRMPWRGKHLWIYGLPTAGRPQIQGQRKIGNAYGSPGVFIQGVSGQRIMIENVEISGFSGNAITQSAECELLIRNCFIHSNGGRALFRGVGCYCSPNLGGTYLIDSELRDAASHTIYLDYGGASVVSGCYVTAPGKSSHCIKNISQHTLVESTTFAAGIDGHNGFSGVNAWVYVDDNPHDPREYAGSAPYDGTSGTDYAMVRNNRFVTPGSHGAMASLQTRSAANGNHPAYPAPGIGFEGMVKAHKDACEPYCDPDMPASMWDDLYWDTFQARQQYWMNNDFVVTDRPELTEHMDGLTVAHDHPVTWSPDNGVPIPVDDGWQTWLSDKLERRVTCEILHKGNRWPTGLHKQMDWRKGIDATYAALPAATEVIRPLEGEPLQPEDYDPMLRRWTGVDLVLHGGGQEPGDPSAPVDPPVPEPLPPVEPPVDPAPEPEPDPESEPEPPQSEWRRVVRAEYQDQHAWYRDTLEIKDKPTY